VPKWVGVPEFHRKFSQYERISYKKLLSYADAGILPTLPRHGQEPFRVVMAGDMKYFLRQRGLGATEIADILSLVD
jgi:hypothetical protein